MEGTEGMALTTACPSSTTLHLSQAYRLVLPLPETEVWVLGQPREERAGTCRETRSPGQDQERSWSSWTRSTFP